MPLRINYKYAMTCEFGSKHLAGMAVRPGQHSRQLRKTPRLNYGANKMNGLLSFRFREGVKLDERIFMN